MDRSSSNETIPPALHRGKPKCRFEEPNDEITIRIILKPPIEIQLQNSQGKYAYGV